MTRNPLAIALAVVAAILIVFGRINHESSWGNWVLIAGVALLVVAGILNFTRKRSSYP